MIKRLGKGLIQYLKRADLLLWLLLAAISVYSLLLLRSVDYATGSGYFRTQLLAIGLGVAAAVFPARDYLLRREGEKQMDCKPTHELVVVITNQGHTDQVMDAARSAGATGGTTIHAKGTGVEAVRKFFGVSIAAEREIVFILTREENRREIMKAVMARAGTQTEAQSVVFSLPVSAIAGLRRLEEPQEGQ